MKNVLAVAVMLLSFAMVTHSASAQIITDVYWELDDYQGVESAYMRSYSYARPWEDTFQGPAIISRPITIMAYTFDSETNAKTFLEVGEKDMESQLERVQIMAEFTDTEIADGGYMISYKDVDDEPDNYMVWSVFRVGDTVFCVIVHPRYSSPSDSEDKIFPKDLDENLAGVEDYIVNADSRSEEVTFSSDGTSSGGPFDRMPVQGDESILGLSTVEDRDLLEAYG